MLSVSVLDSCSISLGNLFLDFDICKQIDSGVLFIGFITFLVKHIFSIDYKSNLNCDLDSDFAKIAR